MRIAAIGTHHAQFPKANLFNRLRAGLFCGSILLSAPAIGNPDIHALAVSADNAALEAALAAGAEPEQRDANGDLPLMSAAKAGRVDAVKALLAAGADPDNTNRFGESSLHVAAAGDGSILQSLLASGANPNARDAGGVTPLMLAAAAGSLTNANLLLAAGARTDMKDYQGSSIKDWALRGGHRELAERLETLLPSVTTPSVTASSGIDFAEDVFVDVEFPDWFKTSFLDLRDDLAEALDNGKQGILLFISASRCSYCKAFMDTSLADPALRQRLTEHFDVIGLEIFDDRELTTLDGREYRVKEFVTLNRASHTPTLIFFGEGGRLLLRIVGYYPPARFRQVLDYLADGAYEHTTLRDYILASEEASKSEATSMIQDDLFEQPPYMLDRSRMPAEQMLLVVFEAPGCVACARFHRRVLQDKAVRRLIGEYEAVQLNAGDEAGRVVTPDGERRSPADWYRALGLNYLPAILFFDEDGEEVMRLDSETLRFRMEGSLQLVLERAHEQDAQLQRWRRTKAIESIQRRSTGS